MVMGYRSDVVFCVQANVGSKGKGGYVVATDESIRDEQFRWFIGVMKLKDYAFMRSSDVEMGWAEHTFIMRFSNIKWSGGYTDVEEVETWWSWCKEISDKEISDKGFSGIKVRVGEEEGDVETEEFGEEIPNIYTVTTVQTEDYTDIFGKQST